MSAAHVNKKKPRSGATQLPIAHRSHTDPHILREQYLVDLDELVELVGAVVEAAKEVDALLVFPSQLRLTVACCWCGRRCGCCCGLQVTRAQAKTNHEHHVRDSQIEAKARGGKTKVEISRQCFENSQKTRPFGRPLLKSHKKNTRSTKVHATWIGLVNHVAQC